MQQHTLFESFKKKLIEVEPFTTIHAFLALIDGPNTLEILQKFVTSCKIEPWRVDQIKRVLSGKHRQKTPSNTDGAIIIPALYPEDIIVSQGIGKPFKVLGYLGKTPRCEKDQVAYKIESTFVGSSEETLYCEKTSSGLVISGYKEHQPRSKFD